MASAAQILTATGAGRSRAYELADRLLDLLPELQRPPGRPAAGHASVPATGATCDIAALVRDYVMDHPGCVTPRGSRRRYSDGFRHFVLDLRERFAELDLETLATATGVPSRTLGEWLREAPTTSAVVTGSVEPVDAATDPTSGRVQTLLAAWQSWHGPFSRFCDHVRDELRLPYGRTQVSRILAAHGVRIPARRPGRSPDEKALRASFVTFFPGAQWVGDGMEVPFYVNGERFDFNLELDVDAHTSALVGACLSDREDAAAVVAAYDDGVCTTSTQPLSLLLDNRDSNHTAEIEDALGDTLRIRATPVRGQSKAPVEGAFGLFSQTAPPLRIDAQTSKQIAEQALTIAIKTWARTLNNKPRSDRGGRSRVEIYREQAPTDEQIAAARAALQAAQTKQEKAYQTRHAREDPVKRDLLDRHFARLALDDPNGNTKSAIARYPLDAILDAIAIFESKRAAQTLPDNAGARYLLGIVKNRAHSDEDLHLIESLIRLRLEARDQLLRPLELATIHIASAGVDPREHLFCVLDRYLDADRLLDRIFWLSAAADLIGQQPTHDQISLFRSAAARLRTAFRVPHQDRQDAILFLARRCPALQAS